VPGWANKTTDSSEAATHTNGTNLFHTESGQYQKKAPKGCANSLWVLLVLEKYMYCLCYVLDEIDIASGVTPRERREKREERREKRVHLLLPCVLFSFFVWRLSAFGPPAAVASLLLAYS
jgi:hypothetical protein